MYIYDTKLKKKTKFVPIKKDEVRIYVCGVTVYDDAHLGHARSSIAFDLIRRVFMALGYKVTYVKNFTDIDDKIIKKMQQSNQDLDTLTNFYIQSYNNEMKKLNVMPADIEPRATKSLPIIEKTIKELLDKDFAYTISDGVYFDTSKDEKYLTLSKRHIEEAKARVEANKEKRDMKDFALWKFATKDEVGFESILGYGRPGWHIECTAMIDHYLAYKDSAFQIDIHGGGADLIFPHHENEASQTRCATGHEIAKYWVHNGFVTINGEKMSKSLGNSFYLKDALKVYGGEVLRYYLSSTYYRADFNFSESDLLATKKRLDKFYRLKKRVHEANIGQIDENFKTKLLTDLKDDINISKALATIDEMIIMANETLDKEPKNKAFKQKVKANIEYIANLLGFGSLEPFSYFQQGVSDEQKAKIETLLQERNEAKKAKDFQKADTIRDELAKQNILLMDTPTGTQWEKDEKA